MDIELKVNGETHQVSVKPVETLLDVLREHLFFTGTKKGCDSGKCGVCTVLIDGKAIKSCLTLAVKAQGREITTIEGLARGEELHPLQQAFIDHNALQCGFCTPGMILAGKALLDENPNPTHQDVKNAITGNLCRCTGYTSIIDAILAAAQTSAGRDPASERVETSE